MKKFVECSSGCEILQLEFTEEFQLLSLCIYKRDFKYSILNKIKQI